jgi:hypothetical protein
VLHTEHRQPHKAAFKAGDKFPLCGKCASDVRFEIVLAAEEENGKGG